MASAKVNGIEICYDICGASNTKTIILISGFGSQMTRWSEAFCNDLVEKGFRVVRLDNRDVGCSARIENEAQNAEQLMAFLQAGKLPKGAYSLQDMAKDVIGLLDHLHIDQVYVAGRSMGGIIAQILAADFPERVKGLVVIMSTSQNPELPPTAPDVLQMMLSPMPDFKTEHEAYLQHKLRFAKRIAGTQYPVDEKEETDIVETELLRAQRANIIGHICAMAISQYNSERASHIKVPTLVVHGTEDPIFPIVHGRDIAANIEGAQLLEIEGMGHDMPDALNEEIVSAIIGLE